MQVLFLFNQDNPFSEAQQYARTGNMKIYNKRASFTDILKDFKSHNVVVGMIDLKNVMYVCYFCNDGISHTHSNLMTMRDFGLVICGIQKQVYLTVHFSFQVGKS